MSRNDIELMAHAFGEWRLGPWANECSEEEWMSLLNETDGDARFIAEAIEALWRGF